VSPTARAVRPSLFLGAVAIAALLPSLGVNTVWEGILLQIVINACAALGMTLLFGFAGQLSIAQAVFVGCGAYAVGIVGAKTAWSPWWGLPIGIAVAMLLAVVVGYPVLRLHGVYLAMATMGLNIAAVVVVVEQIEFTGGASGLYGVEPLHFFGKTLFEPKDIYYLALASFAILFLLAHRLVKSPVGLMLTALRHNERSASLSGIHTSLLKTKVFMVSAAFAAVGGFWLASQLLFVSPESFGIVSSFLFLIMVVIGGTRSLTGAVLGAAFIVVLPQIIPEHPHEQELIFALAFLFVAMFAPRGLVGMAQDAWNLIRRAGRGQSARSAEEGAQP
jgi:branched-chain amino acid transport system permease protein